MTLAPKVSSGVAFEQPVAEPSALAGVANLAGMFASAAPKPTKGPSQADILGQNKSLFYSELQKGRALVEQGKPDQGNRVIRGAYRNFTKHYGREHDDVNTAFTDATGISFDVEVTGNPVDVEQITNTPDFAVTAQVLSSQFPDASPDQIYGMALEKETQRLATDMKISEIEQLEKVGWYDVEKTYVDKANEIGDLARGMLASAEKDQVITPDEARGLRDFWKSKTGSLRKPVGVNQESWDKYHSEYIQQTELVIDAAIGIAEGQGLAEDQARALDSIIAKAVAQGKLPASLLIKMEGTGVQGYDAVIGLLNGAKNDPDQAEWLEAYNDLMGKSFDELLNWVTEFEFKEDISDLQIDPSVNTEFDNASPKQKRDSLIRGTTQMSLKADPSQVALDLINTNNKLDRLGQRALQPGDFSKVFNPGYFSNIQRVFEANPVIGRQIALQSLVVMESQKQSIGRAFESEARQLGFRVQGGKLLPDSSTMPPAVLNVVESFFGGDWDLAVQSGGVDSNGITHAGIATRVNTVKRSLQPQLDKFMGAQKSIDTLTDKFFSEDVIGRKGEEGNLEGNTEDDVLFDTDGVLGLLRDSEGFRNKAYWDVNAWRTGYGSDTVTNRDGSVVPVTKDTVVSREDAERDLTRRTQEFSEKARVKVGPEVWDSLPGNVTDVLTEIAYNYGSVPGRLLEAVRSGNIEDMAVAVEGLKGDNDGINSKRRQRGADIIRGKATAPKGRGPNYTPPPKGRPSPDRTQVAQGGIDPNASQTASGGASGALESTPQETSRETVVEASKRTSEDTLKAKAEFETLAEETRGMLLRLFGNEEAVVAALASNVLDKGDL